MKIQFAQVDQKFAESLSFFKNELQSLRVGGRGSLQLIEAIKAEVYGQNMPIKQIANITMVDASLILVAPWDKSNMQSIVKAVQQSNLGINPLIDGDSVKLPIPPMTEERRKEYIKTVYQKLEEAKISIRQIRKEVLDTIAEDKKNSLITEDDEKRMEKELQNKVDKINQELEKLSKEKEVELSQV